MGREIRRVPANWEHPKDEQGNFIAMYDQDYESRAHEWLQNCVAWDNSTHQDILDDPEMKQKFPFYWEWEGTPPNPDSYRPKFETKPTWFQVYETVSEGTPVTPPFATKEELVNYLVQHGDFWDQHLGDGGWSRKNAENFVNAGYAPALVTVVSSKGVEIKAPRDGA
jgi:hypothetical protein